MNLLGFALIAKVRTRNNCNIYVCMQWQQRQLCWVADFVRSDSYRGGMGWSQAVWAWRPLFRVRVVFFATFPERSRSRPRQTIGPFRKELKNVTFVAVAGIE